MTGLKRVGFLVLVNIAVVAMLSLILNLLGIQSYLTSQGADLGSLAVFCGVWGMAGAFISLFISKWMAKRMFRIQILEPNRTTQGQGAWILDTVHRLAQKANLPKMPEVGVYDSPQVNAFATGPSRSNSLVAVSTGLLNKMSKEEVEGVLGHEVAHIANGDMVTMTLLQGVMNAFVMFFARIAASILDNALSDDDSGESTLGTFGYIGVVIVFEIIFGLLAQIVTSYFSRHREFRADAGSAQLVGKDKMVRALQALQKDYEQLPTTQESGNMAAFQISARDSFFALFSSHPPLANRIAALQQGHNARG